jgi:hypothetical protein
VRGMRLQGLGRKKREGFGCCFTTGFSFRMRRSLGLAVVDINSEGLKKAWRE